MLLALLLVAIALVGCGGDGDRATAMRGGSDAAAAPKVEIAGFAFEPQATRIRVGGAVSWLNGDAAPHTATADYCLSPAHDGAVRVVG